MIKELEKLRKLPDCIREYIEIGNAPKKGAKDYNDWANHHYDPAAYWEALIDILIENENFEKEE